MRIDFTNRTHNTRVWREGRKPISCSVFPLKLISDCVSSFFSETICVTDSGASANKPCIFPFKFNGATHFECTWDQAHLTEHKAWCSTLVDATGHHVGGQGKWGNCGPGCPIPPDDRGKQKPPPPPEAASTPKPGDKGKGFDDDLKNLSFRCALSIPLCSCLDFEHFSILLLCRAEYVRLVNLMHIF